MDLKSLLKKLAIITTGLAISTSFFYFFGREKHKDTDSRTVSLEVERQIKYENAHNIPHSEDLSKPYLTGTERYENDLEERCKDWIYQRDVAFRLGRKGDSKGSAEASRAMNQYYNDLRKRFSETQISDTINRLEAKGYKVGM